MYWFHCNGCYSQPEQAGRIFYITNCSHIYCEKCVTECTKERCKVCQSKCATMELSGNLQKEVASLFDEPASMASKAVKQLSRTLEFQKSHQRRWCRHLKEMLKQQTHQFQELKKLAILHRNLEKESMELKKENSYLKCLLSKNDPGIRVSSRGGNFQGASPNQSVFGRSPHQVSSRGGHFQGASPIQSVFGRSPHQVMQMPQRNGNMNGSTTSGVLNQPGRILMRTPPSDGKLGTTRGYMSYMTPDSMVSTKTVRTPLSVPRPICLSQTE